jgi:hypothetical protein
VERKNLFCFLIKVLADPYRRLQGWGRGTIIGETTVTRRYLLLRERLYNTNVWAQGVSTSDSSFAYDILGPMNGQRHVVGRHLLLSDVEITNNHVNQLNFRGSEVIAKY